MEPSRVPLPSSPGDSVVETSAFPFFSSVVLEVSSRIIWELVRDANYQAPPQVAESKTVKVRPIELCVKKPPRLLWHMLKFENQCPRIFC